MSAITHSVVVEDTLILEESHPPRVFCKLRRPAERAHGWVENTLTVQGDSTVSPAS